jgi:glycosyltransferase involved in cell wall biosynthesis
VIVCTIHGRDPWWPSPAGGGAGLEDLMPWSHRWLFRRIERALCRITDEFVAVSPTVARDAVRAGVAKAGRTSVAPSAVDLSTIRTAQEARIRHELGIRIDAPVVGTVGRIDVQKSPLDFVRMADLVRVTFPDAKFVMVGEGELAEQVGKLAAQRGVPLLMTGYRTDAALVASAFDVYVVSSRYEGVGRAVTEALASGRPVVATAVDGVVDLVAHGSTGLLAAPGDVEGLAAATCWLLEHPVDATAMGLQGRMLVRKLFTRERMCAALDEVYSGLLGAGPDDISPLTPAIELADLAAAVRSEVS